MARRIYLSFHVERDLWRANQVRGARVLADVERVGFFVPAEYQAAKVANEAVRDGLIAARLEGTSVTVVLIGKQTATRDWVQREVELSVARGNGLMGIRVHHLRDHEGACDWFPGPTPSVPAGVSLPIFEWDHDLRRLAREIEAVGRRADARRAGREQTRG